MADQLPASSSIGESQQESPTTGDAVHALQAAAAAQASQAAAAANNQQQSVVQLQDMMQAFWQQQIADIEHGPLDFKFHQLPLARIKKVMKADEDVKVRLDTYSPVTKRI